MLRRFSVDFAIFSMCVDAVLVATALRLATLLRPLIGNILPGIVHLSGPVEVPWYIYVIFSVVWVLIMLMLSLYDAQDNFRFINELSNLCKASFLAFVSLAGLLFLTYRETSRALFLLFGLLAFVLLIAVRVFYRLVLFPRAQQNGNGKQNVLILGAGPVGRCLEKELLESSFANFRVVGFLDDNPAKQAQMDDVLGDLDAVCQVVEARHIEHVVLALPLRAHERITQVVTELQSLPVRIWVIPNYFAMALHHAEVEELAGIPLINLRATALSESERLFKRAMDLALTLVALPFALPLIAVIAMAIKLDSPGPVFFSQWRVGENGKLFQMLKFRSMVVGAEKMEWVIEKVDESGRIVQDKRVHDSRVTRVGRFMRRTSLDELPQLFNVLRGEMSLVGPRPELPHLVAQYEPWQWKRLVVPPGITGWWQVNGRSDKPMHLHTEEDLYYIQNYSIWLDIHILIQTVWKVLQRSGAY